MAKKVFQKGISGNPKGRPKGSRNKKTIEKEEAYEAIMKLLEARLTDTKDVIESLSVGRVADLYSQLLNFKMPKLSSTSNKNENDTKLSGDVNFNIKFKGDI